VSGILIPKRKDGVTVTERQKKFAEYYAQCGNAAQSAIQAGYSKKYANTNASKLLQNTTITEYIKQLTEDAQTARIMTARERQAILSDIAKNKQNELSDRIRAIDTLNKMTGEYTQKVSIDGDVGVKIVDDC
jgi:phage terminase small subunit